MGFVERWGGVRLCRLREVLLVICCAGAVALATSAVASEQPKVARQTDWITLNIPAQPLAKALAAFGAATGFEVIVDGRQAHDLFSSPVAGEMFPGEALRRLLVGTGLVARNYAPGSVRLVAASVTESEFSPASSPHASYFAAVQQMILQTICRTDISLLGSHRLAIMLWLEPSGAVARVKLLDTLGEPGRDAILKAAFQKGDISTPPPADLKQPITLVVRPGPSFGSRDCNGGASEMRRASN
jgi:hypothetical protein